jgi:hypothetical protein
VCLAVNSQPFFWSHQNYLSAGVSEQVISGFSLFVATGLKNDTRVGMV